MKVILRKEAEFDFNESKYTAIPSEVFTTLVGEATPLENLEEKALPIVAVFENKSDYISNSKAYNIDMEKSIYVSPKGQIFCYLKSDKNTTEE